MIRPFSFSLYYKEKLGKMIIIVMFTNFSITTLLGPDKNTMLKFYLCIILSKSFQKIYALFLSLSIITFENDDNILMLYLNKINLSAKCKAGVL